MNEIIKVTWIDAQRLELGGCKYVHVIPKVSILKIIKLQEMKEDGSTKK